MLQLLHFRQGLVRVQLAQPLLPLLEQGAEPHRLVDILSLPLQRHQVAAHTVAHRLLSLLHPADVLNGDAQLAHELNALEGLHLRPAVVPVSVFAVAPGGQQSLFLIEAYILFGDAHQGLHFVDFHANHLSVTPLLYTFPLVESQVFSAETCIFL